VSKQTPLHQIHIALGASFTNFAGWSMPVRYSSETKEHNAVRNAAGLFDLSHMGEIEIVGPQAAEALDYALVGRASKIGVGAARYTMLCDHDGGILDDLVVYRLDEHRFLIVANASNTTVVYKVLWERLNDFDAVVRNTSDDWCLIAVQGPTSPAILAEVTDLDVTSLKYYSIRAGTLKGVDVLVARTGYTGEDGFEIYCTPAEAPAVWIALGEAGTKHDLVPAGLACRDTLRLEAGMPLYGQELTRDVSPYDAGLGRIVNFSKPAGFVGDEALARRRDEGADMTLVGLRAAGRRAPRPGYHVLDPLTHECIGHITSGVPSPTLGYPIAIAYVPIAFEEVGTQLVVDVRGSREDVEVVQLPFYRRNG
jgi:aminomethyltransferase